MNEEYDEALQSPKALCDYFHKLVSENDLNKLKEFADYIVKVNEECEEDNSEELLRKAEACRNINVKLLEVITPWLMSRESNCLGRHDVCKAISTFIIQACLIMSRIYTKKKSPIESNVEGAFQNKKHIIEMLSNVSIELMKELDKNIRINMKEGMTTSIH